MQSDGGRSAKPTRQAMRLGAVTDNRPRSRPRVAAVSARGVDAMRRRGAGPRVTNLSLRRPSLLTSLKCTLAYTATNKLKSVAWAGCRRYPKSTQEPRAYSIEAAIFRSKWQAGIVPGRTLPPYEDIVLGSLGRLTDRLIVVEGNRRRLSRCCAAGAAFMIGWVPMPSTSRSGDCPRNFSDRCARRSSARLL
jgi:hypothetical protein